jgi:hypothetical protein
VGVLVCVAVGGTPAPEIIVAVGVAVGGTAVDVAVGGTVVAVAVDGTAVAVWVGVAVAPGSRTRRRVPTHGDSSPPVLAACAQRV